MKIIVPFSPSAVKLVTRAQKHPVNSKIILLVFAGIMMSCTSYKEIATASTNDRALRIKPGDVIEVTMKSDDLIRRVKVTGIDNLKITGYQKIRASDDSMMNLGETTFMIQDISEVRKRRMDFGNTAGGIVLLSLLILI